MKQKRDKPYVWCTWLTKYITGEQQCEYAAWLKAHYKLDKAPSNFNSRQWNIDHTQLLHKRRDELESKDLGQHKVKVKLEDQNSFKVYLPHGAILSGKADIVCLVLNPEDAIIDGIVDDCKTGKPKDSDQVQVMLYMMFLPICIEEYAGVKFRGHVVYHDHNVPIEWVEIDSNFQELIGNLVKRIVAKEPCRKVPSYNECKWCDVLKEDCPEKVE